ncbi:MAG TPA: hypothetical protein VH207_04620 [Chthoniobacterales bacterium]|nr:hypothetical protein [Chthoniobacterales bacterium]
MKTAISSPSSLQKLPPLSALLLVLAALLALAAWRVLEINQHRIPLDPPAAVAAPQARSAPASSGIRATYQAHRHQAVSLGSSSGSTSASRGDAAGPDSMKAVL